MKNVNEIPNQDVISWPIAFTISLAGMRRRFNRAMITIVSVVLAIAFLCYMLISEALIVSLIDQENSKLNVLLQNNGVDIFTDGKMDQMTLLLLALTLLTSLVGIVNAMIMAVTERVKEIGTLKCLGATDQYIIRAYFIESTIQGICGAAAGALLGLIVAILANLISYGGFLFDNFPVLKITVNLVVSLGIGALLSIFAAIIPAYMAAKKQPIEALRVEE
jgi:ABC-type antimicrobial peptide transport system permease subunit